MRYPASEKLEIIRLVEQSHLPAKRTLDKLGIPRTTFYRWYDRYLNGGAEALDDRSPRPGRVWKAAGLVAQVILPVRVADPSLAQAELGFKPRYSDLARIISTGRAPRGATSLYHFALRARLTMARRGAVTRHERDSKTAASCVLRLATSFLVRASSASSILFE